MRSIKTSVTTAALLTAGFALTAPAAHAAVVVPQHVSASCQAAMDTAKRADAAYHAALEDLKKQMANGGHPGMAEKDNVMDLRKAAEAAMRNVDKMCANEHRHPHGAMRTGVGSTSQGMNGAEIAGGLGVLGAVGAVGAGAFGLRRRAGSRA